MGGFCRFWYIPVEYISTFPRINAANQFLVGEPALVAGREWFGPIEVPRDNLGFTETSERTKAGPYYKTKVEGVHIGDSASNRVNLENMIYNRYLVLAKVRAGGFYILIGSNASPLSFEPDYDSGKGPANTAQTKFSFVGESINKGFVLPTFTSDTLAPSIGSSPGGEESMANKKEIIPFVNQATITVPWTPARLDAFGYFPVVEVWLQEEGMPPYLSVGGSIEVDAPPPLFTELTIKLGGNPSGFIIIC